MQIFRSRSVSALVCAVCTFIGCVETRGFVVFVGFPAMSQSSHDIRHGGEAPMDDSRWLAEQFEQKRTHLRDVALRMLGSPGEAEDAVQEAWLRLSRSDTAEVANL